MPRRGPADPGAVPDLRRGRSRRRGAPARGGGPARGPRTARDPPARGRPRRARERPGRCRLRDVPRRRGVLREAEGRLPLTALRRVSVRGERAGAEEARARMLALFPEGFEEADRGDELELRAYTDAEGERRAREDFGAVL